MTMIDVSERISLTNATVFKQSIGGGMILHLRISEKKQNFSFREKYIWSTNVWGRDGRRGEGVHFKSY